MPTRAHIVASALLLAALGCRENANSPTEPLTYAPATASAATPLAFRQVSAGTDVTCGVATDSLAYCWGYAGDSQLGLGSEVAWETCRYEERPCIKRPMPVEGGLHFRQVSVGGLYHTCGVTTGKKAYCWGDYLPGTFSATPAALPGGLKFRQVSAGLDHTCGVTTTDKAYCWGWNEYGQLGDGTRTPRSLPVLIRGGHTFRQVDAGQYHTCGITTAGRAFCWGSNQYGQLGDSTEVAMRPVPVRVAGGRSYRQLEAGHYHTCAVTTNYRTFCWGDGRHGQLGNGKAYLSFWPRRVASALSFKRVSAGWFQTCAQTTGNQVYCWGRNSPSGGLGDGTTTPRLTPVAVVGGLLFAQLSAGGMSHACGRTAAGVAYCWGNNSDGQLGDGTSTERLTPTPVIGPP